MKKLIALVLAAMLCMAACAALAADLKIGAVMLGDETEGYTLAHMEGIKQAAAELGLSVALSGSTRCRKIKPATTARSTLWVRDAI